MAKARANKRRVHKALKGKKKGKLPEKCCEGVNMKNYYTRQQQQRHQPVKKIKKKRKKAKATAAFIKFKTKHETQSK